MSRPSRGQSPAARQQTQLYEQSGGRAGTTRTVDGTDYPCVLLTYRGRRTGRLLSTPIIRVKDPGRYLLVGSLGGADIDPAWVLNLRADPRLRLRDRELVIESTATELTGDDRDRAWTIAAEVFPPYAGYQRGTSRTIPIFAVTADG